LARQAITQERAQFRARLRAFADTISRLKMAKQAVDQFGSRSFRPGAMASATEPQSVAAHSG